MEVSGNRPVYIDYLLMTVGTCLIAFAIKTIYDPIAMVTGGFTGIAIIAKAFSNIPLWLINIVLNIPIFLIGIKIKGFRFIARTLYATVMLSVWLYVLPEITIMADDYILAAIFGGVICGIGTGMVFLARATTGGTDMVAAYIQHYLRHYTIAQVLQVIDGAVILVGAYIFGLNKALYALISVVVLSWVTDGIIEGLKFSKLAYIITDEYDEVANAIMTSLGRGATGLNATGMYSAAEKKVLLCVVSKKEIVQVKEIVAKIDPRAFVIVSDAREVLGEGFIEFRLGQ
ncbi:YitT family protein [Konateibacter massiliensis]|uniref:YitT family protein n=1 Tax=Konateibacter massiliensis TaxID=2002841 RepID=UPI000C14C6AF|nr:YitT family protein [Konateibacter massiliensis]